MRSSTILTVLPSETQGQPVPLSFRKAKTPLRILLIIPGISLEGRYGGFGAMGTRYPSLGVAQIAAIAELKGHTVKVVDAETMVWTGKYGMEEVRRDIEEFMPDLVGMPTFAMNIGLCHKIARIVKEINPKAKVVLGGAHASMFVKQAIEPPEVDFGTQSEAEIVFDDLLNALDDKTGYEHIRGLAYKDDAGEIRINPSQDLYPDLNKFPKPARHLFPMHLYNSAAILRGKRCLNMMTSRGCPYRCTFCGSPKIFGRSFRYLSTEKVMEEIRELREVYGADAIQFFDETFCANRERVMDLCDAMIREKLNLQWSCFTRPNHADKEMLRKMKEAGCYLIFFGFESGVQRLLQVIKKDTTLEQCREAAAACKEVGIQMWGSFILGLPTETEEESKQTINFAIELDPDYAQFTYFTPMPGTDAYVDAKEQGLIASENFEDYTLWLKPVFSPLPDRGPESVRRSVQLANRRFYLRPRYIVKRSLDLMLHHPVEKTLLLVRSGFHILL